MFIIFKPQNFVPMKLIDFTASSVLQTAFLDLYLRKYIIYKE